jgi:hypothetical protein
MRTNVVLDDKLVEGPEVGHKRTIKELIHDGP